MEKQSIDSERQALHDIRRRCHGGIGGRSFSPLENMDGTNPILDSIEALRGSPLCWEGLPTMDDYGHTRRALDSMQALYERAMNPWEQFRKVQNPKRFMYVLGMGKPADVDLERPALTFPVNIRREARQRYFQLQSTSRFSVECEPNKRELEGIIPPGGPITFTHLAGLVAAVCVVRAVDEFDRTLRDWAGACAAEPGQPFMWLAQHDRDRLEGLLAAYMASPSGDQGYARERGQQACMLVKSAEGWLALSDQVDHQQTELEHATVQVKAEAVGQTLATVKTIRKNQALKAAAAPRRKGKELTAKIVMDYFKANPGKLKKVLIAELSELYKVNKRTVARRYKEVKENFFMP